MGNFGSIRGSSGGSGTGFSGSVNTYADLPDATLHTDEYYAVLTGSGVWLINRKPAGVYYSNGTAWAYLGRSEQTFYDANFKLVNSSEVTKVANFDLSAITAGNMRTVALPDYNQSLLSPTFDGVTFDETPAGSTAEAKLMWDIEQGCLANGIPTGLLCRLGFNLYVKVNAMQPIAAGNLVYLLSSTGTVLRCALASSNNSTANKIFGIAEKAIASGQTGYVTLFGVVSGLALPAASFGAGDQLYLSAAATLTKTAPSEPDYFLSVGFVVKTGDTDGQILFNVVTSDHNAMTNLHAAAAGVTLGHVNASTQSFVGAKTFSTSVALASGATVNEFSTDGTLSGNSDTAVPTEKALVTYINSIISSLPGYVPVGGYLPYAGTSAPTNFLLADRSTLGNAGSGADHTGADFEELFNIVKTGWGNAGTEVFANGDKVYLPDPRGIAIIGAGTTDRVAGVDAAGNAYSAVHGTYYQDCVHEHQHGKGDLSVGSSGSHNHAIDPPSTTSGGQSVTHTHTYLRDTGAGSFAVDAKGAGAYTSQSSTNTGNASVDHTHTVDIASFNSGDTSHSHGSSDFSGSTGAAEQNGANGTPRVSTKTQGAALATNFIIRYK